MATVARPDGASVVHIASLDVLARNFLLKLKNIRRFHHHYGHTSGEMEVDVAVHQPHTRVIGSKAYKEPAIRRYDEVVALHGGLVERIFIAVPAA